MPKPAPPKINHRVNVAILPSSDAKQSIELDYRIYLPGNFSGSEPGAHKDGDGSLRDRKLRVIGNKKDFKTVLEDLNPKLQFSVPNRLSDDPEAEIEVQMDIKDMKDFHPDQIVGQVDPLQKLMQARKRLKDLKVLLLRDKQKAKAIEEVLRSGGLETLLNKLATGEGESA
jgi:type VI secretion system protein ImpB